MKELTSGQEILLNAIKDYINEWGYSPTIRELCQITNKKSPGTIVPMLKRLKRDGYIDYEYNRNRTIRVINNESA
jgi:repressor LexA